MQYSPLHIAIVEALLEKGASSDERLERLPRFRKYAKSTIRSRRAELAQANRVTALGKRPGKRGRQVTVWSVR